MPTELTPVMALKIMLMIHSTTTTITTRPKICQRLPRVSSAGSMRRSSKRR